MINAKKNLRNSKNAKEQATNALMQLKNPQLGNQIVFIHTKWLFAKNLVI